MPKVVGPDEDRIDMLSKKIKSLLYLTGRPAPRESFSDRIHLLPFDSPYNRRLHLRRQAELIYELRGQKRTGSESVSESRRSSFCERLRIKAGINLPAGARKLVTTAFPRLIYVVHDVCKWPPRRALGQLSSLGLFAPSPSSPVIEKPLFITTLKSERQRAAKAHDILAHYLSFQSGGVILKIN
ncbi:hypothetical protein PUN28_014968 [Cardiocondyla obscurior]|uniref:Ribosomal protein S10 n=1 Tax=Cardiocondyla obscurior TaxID=286306 RepID=A0AAW2F026_9HYME